MKYFFIALQFLTPLSIGKVKIINDEDLAKSMAWFGIVGLLIGIALAGAYLSLNLFLPSITVSVLIVLSMVIFSAGLHLDGLADTADGLAGGKDKNDIIKIMHDSNIGAIGAIAIFICLLLKFSCLYSIQYPARALIVSALLSRWAFVFSAARWSSVFENEGLGSKFIKFAGIRELLWSSLTMLIVALFIFGIKAIAIIIIAVFFVTMFNNFIKAKIGVLTGDTLGAVGELTETLTLVIISAIVK